MIPLLNIPSYFPLSFFKYTELLQIWWSSFLQPCHHGPKLPTLEGELFYPWRDHGTRSSSSSLILWWGHQHGFGEWWGPLWSEIVSEVLEKSSWPYLRNTVRGEVTWIFCAAEAGGVAHSSSWIAHYSAYTQTIATVVHFCHNCTIAVH